MSVVAFLIRGGTDRLEPILCPFEFRLGLGVVALRLLTSADLLFKKPFTLSKTVEFMIGAGPEWSYTSRASKISAEFALDLMVWPWPGRKLGWARRNV